MNLIEQIKADREAGTPGPWMAGHFSDDTHTCNCRSILGEHGGFGSLAEMQVDNGLHISEGGNDAPDVDQSKANARRIARVPEMEAIAIAADELAKAGQLLAKSGSVLALAAESTFEGDPALPEAIERFCDARTSHGIALAAFRALVPEAGQ